MMVYRVAINKRCIVIALWLRNRIGRGWGL